MGGMDDDSKNSGRQVGPQKAQKAQKGLPCFDHQGAPNVMGKMGFFAPSAHSVAIISRRCVERMDGIAPV
jgi:hypothetical protein